jgi:hypothetical protein
MPSCAYGLAYIQVQSIVVGQDVIRRMETVIAYVFIRVGFKQISRLPYAFPNPAFVVLIL